MTREEILNMPAGVPLSIRVAEDVMGWQGWFEQRGEYTYFLWQKPGQREPYKDYRDWEAQIVRYKKASGHEYNPHKHIMPEVPEFSRDIKEAWEVAERMKKNWVVEVGANGDFYWCDMNNYKGILGYRSAKADTASLAICRAALLTTLEEK